MKCETVPGTMSRKCISTLRNELFVVRGISCPCAVCVYNRTHDTIGQGTSKANILMVPPVPGPVGIEV